MLDNLITWKTGLLAVVLTGTLNASLATDEVAREAVAVDSSWANLNTVQLYIEGTILMEEGFMHEAERLWRYASNTRPKNRVFRYKHAMCLMEVGPSWRETLEAFEKVTKGSLARRFDPFDPMQKSPPVEALLWQAAVELRLSDFEAAREHVDKYLDLAGEKHQYRELASDVLGQIRFAERNLKEPGQAVVTPSTVNSDADDSHPILTADGQTMFFSSNRSRKDGSNHGRMDPNTKAHYQDVYRSTMAADSSWSDPEHLNLGIRNHATVLASDAFGQKLVVEDFDGWNRELKVTQKWERGWTAAEALVLDKRIPSNGAVAFFPSRERLIVSFSSRRGEGGFDLYESELNSRGRWTKPKSLGVRVNTWGDEITPFVAADGQTVFFASNGLQRMGGFDIYRTTRDAAGGWTEPEHLGGTINSVADDMAFAVGAQGEVGYFASSRSEDGRALNIYEVNLNDQTVLESDVLVVTLDASNTDEADAPRALVVRDSKSGEVIQRADLNELDETFQFILPGAGEFVLESSSGMAESGAEGSEATPSVRRKILLPESLNTQVLRANYDEVFAERDLAESGTAQFVFTNPEPEPTAEAVGESKEDLVEEVVEETSEAVAEHVTEKSEENVTNPSAKDEPMVTPPEEEEKPEPVQVSSQPKRDAFLSAPVAPLAVSSTSTSSMLMAVQLYSGQIHTERMDLSSVEEAIVQASRTTTPLVRIEGSASDGPSSRPDGNEGLASARAMDVYLRLVARLDARGLTKGKDYTVRVVRRVQPDGDTPAAFKNASVEPASFQYVRVDLSVE